MHYVKEVVPKEHSIVIAKNDILFPCYYFQDKFYKVSAFKDGFLELSTLPEKVTEWSYELDISWLLSKKEDIEKEEITLLKALMLKYKNKLI